jgi:hypothetical protein
MFIQSFDYSVFEKKKYEDIPAFFNENTYDLFVSGYNDSLRVKTVFEKISAKQKDWLLFPQYGYTTSELPNASDGVGVYLFPPGCSESQLIRDYFKTINNLSTLSICIDITGFVRPHILFLVRYLSLLGVTKLDFVYSDPVRYKKKENTTFSDEYTDVRQVQGCHGTHSPDSSNDFLIIGAGYDHQRITDVSKSKANTTKVQLFGFPSLQPDMFQENILKAYKAEEASGSGRDSFIDENLTLFAPANDPFETANVLKTFLSKEDSIKKISNLYLCPLSTKAQTLGFALFYVWECLDKPVSLIFPFCERYSRETTEGISRVWRYAVELPNNAKS